MSLDICSGPMMVCLLRIQVNEVKTMVWLRSILIVVLIVVAGCDRRIQQVVLVDVSDWHEGPKAFRLHSIVDCSGEFLQAIRLSRTKFEFRTDSTKGGIGVVTQELSLCYEVEGRWNQVWWSRHGGGARQIKIWCEGPESTCTEEFFY